MQTLLDSEIPLDGNDTVCHDMYMPVISVPIQPETKILLDALSILMQMPTGRVIETLASAYLQALPAPEAKAISALKEVALTRIDAEINPAASGSNEFVTTYKFSRLCFKRDVIEALGPTDTFRVETPVGTFQMTKADFYRVFPNVVQSRSYLSDGIYHYRKLPGRAEEFRVV
jgi:hypothetical protein